MLGTFINRSISRQFVMLKTLDRISADITGIGMNRKRGAIRSRVTTRKTACRMPAMGVCAPRRALSNVWEETPEVGRPPAKAQATFTPPCTKSSPFESKCSPVSLAAGPIAWYDSVATRTAIANPCPRMLPSRSSLKASARCMRSDIESDPKSDPIACTGKYPNFTNKAPAVIATRLAGMYAALR